MTDLVEWLKARLDEDERKANIISPGGYAPTEWRAEPVRSGRWMQLIAYDRTNVEPPGSEQRAEESPTVLVADCRAEWAHIVRWDPAAVVRLVAGAREILAEHTLVQRERASFVLNEGPIPGCATCWGELYPCRTVLLLAKAWGWEEEGS